MRKTGSQFKMIFYQVLVILLIMLAITSFFYQYLFITLSEQSAKDFDTIIAKSAGQYEKLLYDMDRTALQIAANPSIVKAFQKVDKSVEENYFIREPAISAEIVRLLNSYNFKMDSFARICLYNDHKDFVCTAARPTTITGMNTFFKSSKYDSIRKHFKDNDNFLLYLPPEEDCLNDSGISQEDCFSIVREIKDYSSNSSKCGYVEVQESVGKIDSIFGDIGDQCGVVLLDEANKVVYENPFLKENRVWGVTMERIVEEVRESGGITSADSSVSEYVSYQKLEKAPYAVLAWKHSNAILEPLIKFNLWLIIGILLIILTAVVTEVLLVKRLSKPLSLLNKSIQNLDWQKLRIEIDGSDDNELQQLEKTFNSMLIQLKETMDHQYIAETNELKSHLFALQSQMNPHFLYNILAIISMEAQEDGNEKIQNICTKLCRILTYTSSMKDGFGTVEEEISNAENYMILMKERYEVLFEYDISVEEQIKKIRIPRLIVQPICENCFAHAFKDRDPVWRINIRVYTKNGGWYIRISDNGSGFSDKFLADFKEMKETVTLGNVKEKMAEISIGGLCIPNIYMRLKICYDNDFTCELYNEEAGAVVLLGGRRLNVHD